MKVETLKNHTRPIPCQMVAVKVTGNITEIRYCTSPQGCKIEKLDKDHYIDLTTGEYCEFEHHEKRIDDLTSLSQSLKRLRELINCNVTDPQKCKWLTLTYRENMQDAGRLYEDFRAFNAHLRYWLKTNGLPRYEYIAVAEPQRRGAWHLHCFLIFPCAAPFIHYDIIREKWKQGAIDIKALGDIDNVGAYLTPYLTDLSLVESLQDGNAGKGIREVEETDENGNITSKAYIKGGRLKYYPAGFRLYRASRGIQRPIIYECTEEEALQSVGSAPLTYEKTVRISDETDGKTVNVINYRQYNKISQKEGRKP